MWENINGLFRAGIFDNSEVTKALFRARALDDPLSDASAGTGHSSVAYSG